MSKKMSTHRASFARRLTLFCDPRKRGVIFQRVKSLFAIWWRNIFWPHPAKIIVGDRAIGAGAPVFIIAEIGVNHNGSVERAKKLIDAAVDARADAVKFQKRHLEAAYQKAVLDHPEYYEQAFQYLIPLLKEFELGEAAYRELAAYAKQKGILFFASAFDEPSVYFLSSLCPPLYKIASADLVNTPLLERVVKERVPIILSTGMSTLDEIDEAAAFLCKQKAVFVLLHCQSTYPAPVDMLNLAMIQKLRSRYRVPVGYSGHELGINHTLAAVALGASVVERHITLDRGLPGPDHAASLEPDEFKKLVEHIREFEIAHGIPVKRISRGEFINRLTLRKSLVAAVDIPRGVRITREMIVAKGPGMGLSPQRFYNLLGRKANRNIQRDGMFVEADLFGDLKPPAKLPHFSSKWGLKARFFELEKLSHFEPKPVFFEFHMSDEDLEYRFGTSKRYSQELYVHAPEYWRRQVVDLASEDSELREQSVRVIQRTIDKTREIAKCFSGTPKIIIHVGGASIQPSSDPQRLLLLAEEAFRRLDTKGVEILPENLPPFGWLFSGLWFNNIFGAADEMIDFCKRLGYSMCLDLSHAWLYCTHHGIDYPEYIQKIAPYVSHLHISDGRGSHKEGLQIGDGDVPFAAALEALCHSLPGDREISWVPEIWQGHLDDYRQFKIALTKLAKYPMLYEGIRARGISQHER